MKIYKIIREDLDYQIAVDKPATELLQKNIYQPIDFSVLRCFQLNKKEKLTDVLKEARLIRMVLLAVKNFVRYSKSLSSMMFNLFQLKLQA